MLSETIKPHLNRDFKASRRVCAIGRWCVAAYFSLGIIVTGDCIIMSTFRAHIVASDMPGFTEHIVAHRHILSPVTIYAAQRLCVSAEKGRGRGRHRQTDRADFQQLYF